MEPGAESTPVGAPIEEACYWFAANRGRDPRPAVRGRIDADVAVIGAGFTGLWATHFLQRLRPDLSIVVIEQGFLGYGASGRNAGIIGACLDHTHGLAVRHFGLDEAVRLAHIGVENLHELGRYATGCDFEHTGQLHVALTPEQVQDCVSNVELARGMGLEGHRLLGGEETRAEIASPLLVGSRFSPDAAIVDPVKLVHRLGDDSERLGARLHEASRVLAVEGDRLHLEHGEIRAPIIVLATDAYSHQLFPSLLHRFIPLYDYILVSEPLSASEKASVGWPRRQGVTDGRAFFNYYRLTADDRILWGTSDAAYFPPNRVDPSCDRSPAHFAALEESFRRFFPQLAGLRFPHAWGGPIASTTRLTPFFGTLEGGRVHYALGYTGHGIASTRLAGRILAHTILERPSPLLDLAMVRNKPFPYPPEPLRGLAVRAVSDALRRMDEGDGSSWILKALDALGLGFSS